ncbi:alpha-amylase family glycosyl hydrolase [Paenibacillus sp. CCS19]|uniref:alpha-amylase family glycosyl hydrolase n=1 Tax=Paenibacillus sp. CCS19 TaxID=3158387 RepID=UPI00295EB2C0|nr:alpha-amylase family glycosyl hydrolase [Paenibacillus cellulosilyticus]
MRRTWKWLIAMPLLVSMVGLTACSAGEETAMQKEPVKETADSQQQSSVGRVPTPDWAAKAVMYEVNVRQYTKEGTFSAFEQHLPRLKELGVDILWFMPIYPISHTKRNGTVGSPYAVDDYKAVNPDMGTADDFKSLVNKAHELGFKVMLDWVANHTGWDNPWLANQGWYTTDEAGNVVMPPNTNWSDVADLNYENADMQAAMLDAMKYWVSEFDIDGYRADYAGGVPKAFWEQARVELEKLKPLYMLAEDDQQISLLSHAFNSNYGWQLYNTMNRLAKGQGDARQVASYADRLAKSFPSGTYPLNFTSNHDENAWTGTEYERLGDAVKTMAALSFTLPGMPLIYSGQEAGLNRRLPLFEKDEIGWGDLAMQTFYKSLVDLKHNNEALWNGSAGGVFHTLEAGDNHVLAFERTKNDNTVVVVMNLSAEQVATSVKLDAALAGAYTTQSGGTAELKAEQAVDLAPWAYEIYVNQ